VTGPISVKRDGLKGAADGAKTHKRRILRQDKALYLRYRSRPFEHGAEGQKPVLGKDHARARDIVHDPTRGIMLSSGTPPVWAIPPQAASAVTKDPLLL
jgi:hypothetical protein